MNEQTKNEKNPLQEIIIDLEVARAVKFLSKPPVKCYAKFEDLKPFYEECQELPKNGVVWDGHSERIVLDDGYLVQSKKTFNGHCYLPTNRISIKGFNKEQLANIYACWAWTTTRERLKNSIDEHKSK